MKSTTPSVPNRAEAERAVRRDTFRVVITYAATAALWIVFSDKLVGLLARDTAHVLHWSIIKGLGFVGVTAGLLSVMLVRMLRRLYATQAELSASEQRFRAAVESAPDAIMVQTQGRFAYVNAAALRLFGAESEAQLLGQPILERFHPDHRAQVAARMRCLNEARQAVPLQEGAGLRLDGSPVELEASAVPFVLRGQAGALGFARDISQRKRAEAALRRSLEEKTALLKEVHHRVKNNLQIVASLLNLQADHTQHAEAIAALRETSDRVRSMALLHEALYGSGTLAHINFSAYVEDLCAQLLRAHGPVAARVQVDVRVAGVGLPLEQSVPCGLIINELVSNALKHAFPGHRPGRVLVEASLIEPTMLRLRVSDNGVGLPGGFEPLKTGTLGLQLVATLAKQLRGKLAVEESSAVGAAFTVAFPIPELASEPEP